MKRFTEAEKWRDGWFSELEAHHKLLWLWLCDRCDPAGVVDISWKVASFETGMKLAAEDLVALKSKVEPLPSGKVLIPGFIPFQYPNLSIDCKPHKAVFAALEKHGLLERFAKGKPKATETLEEGNGNLPEPEKNKGNPKKGKVHAWPPAQLPEEIWDAIQRLNAPFHRREETPWTEKELKAIKLLSERPSFAEELALIETRYKTGGQYLRQDIQTLLNNWCGEVDRARNTKNGPAPASEWADPEPIRM